ncbi:MAG: hypothetical protein ABEK59_04820 [Halobacteria archaeon]
MRRYPVAGKVFEVDFAFGIRFRDIFDLLGLIFVALMVSAVVSDILPSVEKHTVWIVVGALFLGVFIMFKSPPEQRPRNWVVRFLKYQISGNEYYHLKTEEDRGKIKIQNRLLTGGVDSDG